MMEDKVKKLKNNKTLKIIMNIIRVIIIVILAAFVLVVCMQRFSNNKLSLLNHRLFAVVTGSMEPKYKVGDVLISKDIDPSKIKVGDTVVYNSKFAKDFDLFKDSKLIKVYDIIAKKK